MAKKKKRNRPGRKPPSFALLINKIAKACQLTLEEIQPALDKLEQNDGLGRKVLSPNDLPEGSIVVDSLNGHTIFNAARCFDHIDTISLALQEFDDEFWEGKGCTIGDLRRDRKNRVWGDDMTIMNLIYVGIAMELIEWSYPRTEWPDLPHKMPYIKFKGPRRNEATETTKEGFNEQEESTTSQ